MARDEEFRRWYKRWMRFPFFGLRPFEDFESRFEEMEKMLEEALGRIPKDLIKERKLPDGRIIRETGPIVYGYSVTIGPDGKPVIREFGNVKTSGRPLPFGFPRRIAEVRKEREPLVDVMSENDVVRVVAELPGVDKSDINLSCTENLLTISVDTEKRRYHKALTLPAEVEPKSAKAKYRNGVLEVILEKAKKEKMKGKRIEVE